jgi:hypothetical protein
VDPEVMDEIALFLKPDHFLREQNKWTFQAMLDLYVRDVAIDQITVCQQLAATGKLEAVGGAGYAMNLVIELPTSLHGVHYAKIVQRMSVYRDLITAAGAISKIAYAANGSIPEALEKAQGLIERLWAETGANRLVISDLKRIGRDSPVYHISVNGKVIRSESKVLLDYKLFRQLVLEACDFIPPKMKQEEWEARVNRLLQSMHKDPGPLESSETHLVWAAARKHLKETLVVETLEEFLAGRVLEKNLALYVKGEYLLQGVRQRLKNPSLKANWFWDIMRDNGAKDTTTRIGGKTEGCWKIPLENLQEKEGRPSDEDEPLLF